MATVSAKVYEHHKKKDGTFNVKIIVYHQQDRKHIDTIHFVSKRQLTPDLEIKDKFLNKIIDDTLDDYRTTISNLGTKLDFFTCEELRDYLRDKDKEVDFIEFCTEHIRQERKDKRDGSANNHRRVKNSLIDYFKKDSVSINEITSHMLISWERYLKTDREQVRVGKSGVEVISTVKGMKKGGLYTIMRDLRTLFNAAVEKYNDEERGILKIKHYPFKKYKLGAAPKTRKRNISLEQVKIVCDCEIQPGSWSELSRDLFMLSFYMCGLNAVDMYQLEPLLPGQERLEYNRSKTRDIREDNAFISIYIPDEARPILEKYAGKLQAKFVSHNGLNTALSIGMKDLCKIAGLAGVTFYWARHSFANIARNKGGMHTDDIGLALNHVDEEHPTTDIYLDKDWSLADLVQNCVLNLFRVYNTEKLTR
ncbi:tyrosine-type recombinase/integrase [Mucilaginibacter celer]|uniref:Recombinase n=1 Tax=Mucilaginibacter celer TaxID=2305508 RepID=A0A494VJU7_9SPHI|nr:site-specific integrase [Mucilaginibacter celer]AYL95357.1 recombinase [Mucilaginibacter celer]